MSAPEPRPVIAVAGAAGFIGQALAPHIGGTHALRGISRSERTPGAGGYDHWIGCDLFSLRDAEQALQGASRAVYLVHSVQRLVLPQGETRSGSPTNTCAGCPPGSSAGSSASRSTRSAAASSHRSPDGLCSS